jgi:6-phosphofructokinase
LRACPKTIDNDLSATELTFGFDTALHTVSGAIAKIHTTASSHHRVMVVEVMGRDCGRIALAGGISGGAHIILIPEIPFPIKSGCDFIALRESRGGRFTIVVVAEGIRLPPELKQMARGWSVGNTIGDATGLFANIVSPTLFANIVRQQGSAGQRAGAHSARWIAIAVRPGAGDALRVGADSSRHRDRIRGLVLS